MLSPDKVSIITILDDFFCTVTPCCFTASGNEFKATLTRFCTITVAISISVPTSKVTVKEYIPDADEVELIYIIPSTPFTCCSIGIPTVCATVSALAPGYAAFTCTVGGVISGYCATGNTLKVTNPATTINKASTVAKIGRSIKNFENISIILVY